MGVLVSFSTLLRMVALGFALGIVVGLYFGTGGPADTGSATCSPDRPAVERCVPPAGEPSVNPAAAP